MKARRLAFLAAIAALPLLFALLALGGVLLSRQGGLAALLVPGADSAAMPVADASVLARGRYLARLGNCEGCHSAPGGEPHAGGRAFRTAYGTVYSSNLTPDREHGIGDWSAAEFRHAMRHGVSRNGVLSPVFPYASFRHLTDADLDALLAHLRTLAPSTAPRRASSLRFPANLPGAMLAWRLLYHRPQALQAPDDPQRARGAYLVQGIGHCATCHAARGAFAAPVPGVAMHGGRAGGWYAPALDAQSLQRFGPGGVATYLQGGEPGGFAPYGLMADVVMRNLQHLTRADAAAMEAYLRRLPAPSALAHAPPVRQPTGAQRDEGRALYAEHCADCHGARGEGVAGKYPPLEGSSAIGAPDPVNLVKLVLFGAVAPTTATNPRPHTMPPFAGELSAPQVAALVNELRLQADPDAVPVDADDVRRMGGL